MPQAMEVTLDNSGVFRAISDGRPSPVGKGLIASLMEDEDGRNKRKEKKRPRKTKKEDEKSKRQITENIYSKKYLNSILD